MKLVSYLIINNHEVCNRRAKARLSPFVVIGRGGVALRNDRKRVAQRLRV